jgi:hypothetical protein
MKKILFIIIAVSSLVFGQQAQDYFPANPGYLWYSKTAVLDSLNNPIEDQTIYNIDSFAVDLNYEGKAAKLLLSKSGGYNSVRYQPFIDSGYVSLEGTDGYQFFDIAMLNSLIGAVDTSGLDSLLGEFNLIEFLGAFAGWYSTFKFAEPVGSTYQLIQFDTTLTIDTLELPLRIKLESERLNDETITTEAGTYTCKKFLSEFSLNYLVIINPFPPVPVPIVTLGDSIWVGEGSWIVKQYLPSNYVDLSILELPSFTIPGRVRETIPEIPLMSVEDDFSAVADQYVLNQNYPNPFNPATTISFTLPEAGKVSLKVFDIIGNEIAELIDGRMQSGTHSITFNTASLPFELSSGIYFYRIEANDFVQTRKMTLLK